MATLNASKWGYILGPTNASVSTARTSNGVLAVNNPTSAKPSSIQYLAYTSRGTLVYNMIRTFLYFDTTGITGAVTNASLEIEGDTNFTADVIACVSTAFGGNGASALTNSDFYSSINYNVIYSSQYSSWSTTNSIPLNNNANSHIQNNNVLILALVEYDFDFLNTGSGFAATRESGVEFATTIKLVFTEAGGGGPSIKLNGVDSTNIEKWDGTSWGNISKINGVS